ncbi:hypothetical protein AAFA46_05510 [Oscillospiraceae bacterium WX1]
MKKYLMICVILIFSLLFLSTVTSCINANKIQKSPSHEVLISANTGTTVSSNQDQKISDYYEVSKVENGYIVYLFDKNKNIVSMEELPREPYISIIDNNIRITESLGSPLNYSYFYDVKTNKISPIYENVLLIGYGNVVYMKNKQLIISNIYDASILYQEVKRNFSNTAVPSSAILSLNFVDSNKLEIDYLKGENFTETTEIIVLKT